MTAKEPKKRGRRRHLTPKPKPPTERELAASWQTAVAQRKQERIAVLAEFDAETKELCDPLESAYHKVAQARIAKESDKRVRPTVAVDPLLARTTAAERRFIDALQRVDTFRVPVQVAIPVAGLSAARIALLSCIADGGQKFLDRVTFHDGSLRCTGFGDVARDALEYLHRHG